MARENVNANVQRRKTLLKAVQSGPGLAAKARGGFAPNLTGIGKFNRATAPKGVKNVSGNPYSHKGGQAPTTGASTGTLPGNFPARGGAGGQPTPSRVGPGAGPGRRVGPQPTQVPGTGGPGRHVGPPTPTPHPQGGGDFVGLHGMPKKQLAAFMKAHKGEGRFKRTPHPPPNPPRTGHTTAWYIANGYVYDSNAGQWIKRTND